MDYFEINVNCKSEHSEILIALFSTLHFESFYEKERGFKAYIPSNKLLPNVLTEIKKFQSQFGFVFEKKLIKDQNWNKKWESNFSPILVDDFCGIRANFHEVLQGVDYEIVINPKMAFGTGHHETTWMVIKMMREFDFVWKKVLDYGCGTGILGILAGKLGAKEIDAVDNDFLAFENTLENTQINRISNINTFHGTLNSISGTGYDFILANINRNVILESLPTLFQKVKKGGTLIVSGFLQQDEILLKREAVKVGFTLGRQLNENEWICLQLVK